MQILILHGSMVLDFISPTPSLTSRLPFENLWSRVTGIPGFIPSTDFKTVWPSMQATNYQQKCYPFEYGK